MKLRILLIFVLVLFSVMSSRGQYVIKPRNIALSVPGKFSEVAFWGQTNLYGVKITLGSRPHDKPEKQPDADELAMQMWLLQANGTTIPQLDKPAVARMGSLGSVDTCLCFSFVRSPTSKPVGVVVSYRGELYCKQIEEQK